MSSQNDNQDVARVLTVNQGSSTLKSTLYNATDREDLALSIKIDRLGAPGSHVMIEAPDGTRLFDHLIGKGEPNSGLGAVLQWLGEHGYLSRWKAAGHRLVHGGAEYKQPQRVTPELLAKLDALVPLDPDHLPQALSSIRFIAQKFPSLPQVACFDTAFHSSLPKVARMYGLPRRFYDAGVMRYGFHGLSYEYILHQIRGLDGAVADGRVIIAHLGNGASMVALHGGNSMDTSMGFTPLEGLLMGTRSGDADPGALVYLLEHDKMTPGELSRCLNQQSGLLGVSGSSEDMRDLLEKAPTDPSAAEAIELFCYRAKKYIGGYAAALGGLDLLVFTGGIGERAAAVRERICGGLEFLGLELDPMSNHANDTLISRAQSRVKVRVLATNEDLMIVRHVLTVLG